MTTIQEINSAIMFGNLTNDQLDSVVMAVRFRRSELTKQNKRMINIGNQVKFYSTKRGQTFHGTVTKIATKFVTVNTGQTLWKVPANMLELV